MSDQNKKISVDLTVNDGRDIETKLRILEKFRARAGAQLDEDSFDNTRFEVVGDDLACARMVQDLKRAKFTFKA
jgi:hypothetical protein